MRILTTFFVFNFCIWSLNSLTTRFSYPFALAYFHTIHNLTRPIRKNMKKNYVSIIFTQWLFHNPLTFSLSLALVTKFSFTLNCFVPFCEPTQFICIWCVLCCAVLSSVAVLHCLQKHQHTVSFRFMFTHTHKRDWLMLLFHVSNTRRLSLGVAVCVFWFHMCTSTSTKYNSLSTTHIKLFETNKSLLIILIWKSFTKFIFPSFTFDAVTHYF